MSSVVVRRLRDASELLALAEPYEPDSIRIVGDVREQALGRHVRAWVVEDGATPLGVVTVARLARDRWYASPLLFDERAAAAIGALVERSRAREMAGGPAHIDPLVAHVARAKGVVRMPFLVDSEKYTLPPGARDPRARVATADDLDALVDLYSGFELEQIPTRPRLRAYLRRTIHHRALIVGEVDGTIVGAFRLEFRGSAYDMWSGGTILPEHRGRGLYRLLVDELRRLSVETDRRNCFTISQMNHLPLDRQRQGLGTNPAQLEWVVVPLTPRRVTGEPRVRRAIELLEGPVNRRLPD